MKEIQEETLLEGRKTYVRPSIKVCYMSYEHSLLGLSLVGIENQPGDAMNSGGAGSDNVGGTAGEIGDDAEINNAKAAGSSIWDD